jgi:hypothetical protein
MAEIQHIAWTFLLLFACGSCFFGVRRDTFWWAMMAGVAGLAFAFNGAHELGQLVDVIEGRQREIRLTAETAIGGILWIARTGRWLHG